MILKRLWCNHEWEVVFNRTVNPYQHKLDKNQPNESQHILVQRCKKCGKVQKTITKFQ